MASALDFREFHALQIITIIEESKNVDVLYKYILYNYLYIHNHKILGSRNQIIWKNTQLGGNKMKKIHNIVNWTVLEEYLSKENLGTTYMYVESHSIAWRPDSLIFVSWFHLFFVVNKKSINYLRNGRILKKRLNTFSASRQHFKPFIRDQPLEFSPSSLSIHHDENFFILQRNKNWDNWWLSSWLAQHQHFLGRTLMSSVLNFSQINTYIDTPQLFYRNPTALYHIINFLIIVFHFM